MPGSGARHIVFATLSQLQLLNNTSVIYCDATFQVVGGNHLVSCLVSILFLSMLIMRCQTSSPRIHYDVTSSQKRLYGSIQTYERNNPHHESNHTNYRFRSSYLVRSKEDFPNIAISVCNFHWGQTLWRKVQELGYQSHIVHLDLSMNILNYYFLCLSSRKNTSSILSLTEIAASGSSDINHCSII